MGATGGAVLAGVGLYGGALRPLAPLVALTLFVAALRRRPPAFSPGAAVGFAFGLFAHAGALAFLATTAMRFSSVGRVGGAAAVLVTAAAQAAPYAAVGGLFAKFRPASATGEALLLAVLLHLATFAPGLFPWTAAVPLAHLPEAIQLASFFGERGLVFLLGALAVLLAFRRRDRNGAALAAPACAGGALLAIGLFGAGRLRSVEAARETAPRFPVALVDARIDAQLRWEAGHEARLLEALHAATRTAPVEAASPQEAPALIVWPEAAYPFVLPRGARREPIGPFAILPEGEATPVLTGLFLSTKRGTRTNAVVVAFPDGTLSEAAEKRHLVLFGEHVPFVATFPFLRRWFGLGVGIEAGGPPVTISVQNANIGTLVCFEDTLPDAGLELFQATKTPNLLINVTNDAWFTGTAESELHASAATFRAVELGRDLVRAVNGGVSTHITASGRRLATRDAAAGGALATTPVLLESPSVYARFGDRPLLLLDGLFAIGLLVGRWRTKRNEAPTAVDTSLRGGHDR